MTTNYKLSIMHLSRKQYFDLIINALKIVITF